MVGSAWPNEAGCLKKLLQILRVERSLFRASNACASGDHQQPEDDEDDHFGVSGSDAQMRRGRSLLLCGGAILTS